MTHDPSRTIVVTGGAGYIGSHTCKALSKAGYNPVVVDNLSYGHSWAVKWGPLEHGDIRDKDFLDSVFSHYKPSAVIHFAGLIQVGESVLRPDIYYDNNVVGTMSLLDRMRAHDIGKIVFSSTCAIFGLPGLAQLHEDLPIAPINPYGASKAIVEQLLKDYSKAYGIRSAALRYFNAAGADFDGELGEAHNPETHLIPLAIAAALGQRPQLTIFGDDYPTRDGTCIRDYIHVDDLADAHLRAVRYLDDQEAFSTFNLGNGEGYSVLEIIDAVKKVSGKSVPSIVAQRRDGDAVTLVADSSKAKEVLGWKPAVPSLYDIVASAWRWHSKLA